jgi:hypothetical protein
MEIILLFLFELMVKFRYMVKNAILLIFVLLFMCPLVYSQDIEDSTPSFVMDFTRMDVNRVFVKYRKLDILQNILIDLGSPDLRVKMDSPSSSLILAGKMLEIEKLGNLVRELDVPIPEVDIHIRYIEASQGNIKASFPPEIRDVEEDITSFWNFAKYDLKYKVHIRAMEQSSLKVEFGDGVGISINVLKINKQDKRISLFYELTHSPKDISGIKTLLSSSFSVNDGVPEVLGGSRLFRDKEEFVLLVFNVNIIDTLETHE